jgi:cellulose synthase/poly-beta-1,6-N-acetylglucosamine synthase-like glycosyltransferase
VLVRVVSTDAAWVVRSAIERLADLLVGRVPDLRALAPRLLKARVLAPLALATTAAGAAAWLGAGSLLYLAYIGVCLLLSAVAWTTLVWMLNAWRTPRSLAQGRLKEDDLEPVHSFSLIVPARHEETVLEATLSRLVKNDHPAYEVLVVVGDDDPGTREVAERMADRHPELVKVVVDTSRPKSKPKALNAALSDCMGEIVGVFDAEDIVHPALLTRVDQRFQRSGADVVQAGVQLMNLHSSWLTVRNVLEYYFWFRSRLHVHARQGFIPLGGNTVFIRTEVLRAVSGWDPECLAEDCELGVRLSSFGARTVVAYEPELVTREECPPTLGAFARQRTRWNQGYLQTLARGYWRRLPRRQRMLGVYILAVPYVMAITWLLIPIAIGTAVAVDAPILVTLLSFLPALPMLSMCAVEVAGLGEFCRAYGERASPRDYGRLIFGLPLYQAVLAYSAARAVAREARGVRGWEKTAHMGLHLGQPANADVARATVPLPVPSLPARRLQPVAALAHEVAPRPVALAMAEGHSGSNVGATPRAPLWTRLDSVSADGAASLSLPSLRPSGFAVAVSRLGSLRAFLLRLAGSHVDLAVLLPLLVGVGIVQATNMFHWPAVQFDEGTYVGNAWAVQEHGVLAFYTYTYGHPPLGWLLIALWTWVSGIFGRASYSLDGGREVMFAVSMVSCWLLYNLARRLRMSPPFAAGAVLLFALCPLSLFFHRGVLLDNPATAWALAAFVLALTPRRSLWAFAASGACFAASLLCKETTLVLLPALLLAAAQNSDPSTRRYCLTLFAAFLGLTAVVYPLYATLKGELVPGPGHVSLIGAALDMLFYREKTGSVLDPHSAAHWTVMLWVNLDPWLVGAGLLLSPIALALRNTRAVALAFLIQVVIILRPGYLPAMYVIALLPFAALIVMGTAQALWRHATTRSPRARLPAGGGRWRMIGFRAAVLLRPVSMAASAAALAVLLAVAVLVVAPRWARADKGAMTVRLDGPERAAERWLVQHVDKEQRLIVTDDFWVYLVEHGFDSQRVRGGLNSRTVVSFWPFDKDPAVRRLYPHGWRDFDYVVSTVGMRANLSHTPNTAQAIRHSRVVASFGREGGQVEIRAIVGGVRRDHDP